MFVPDFVVPVLHTSFIDLRFSCHDLAGDLVFNSWVCLKLDVCLLLPLRSVNVRAVWASSLRFWLTL